VKYLIESYEGVAIIRTLDRRTAVVVVFVVPDMLATADAIIAELIAACGVRRVAAPPEAVEDWLLVDVAADQAEGSSAPLAGRRPAR